MATKANALNFDRGALGQVVLVLQGGGALGAYQAGVYQALSEAGMEPDWVIGTSIGAVNAGLIAGNAPEQRLQRLEEFWRPSLMGRWCSSPPQGHFSALGRRT
jgi:NTE family protein